MAPLPVTVGRASFPGSQGCNHVHHIQWAPVCISGSLLVLDMAGAKYSQHCTWLVALLRINCLWPIINKRSLLPSVDNVLFIRVHAVQGLQR